MDYPQIPGYIIKERLGQGGMASVYLATQEKFHRQVALKVMAAHLVPDPSFGERFLREAHIVAQMSHRNFVPVFDVGQHGDLHYMSMEYLPNGDLKELMARGLPLSEGLRIVREVASGLHYASSKSFVHRDIKPENILFREDHSSVICDFGIARSMDSNTQMTVVGSVIGTAFYMSPEQAKAEPIDGRSDLYSLGVIVYEMLAGEVPYSGSSATAVSIKHVSDPVPRLPERLQAFQVFIDRALAKHPDDRFQTGDEMIAALDELEDSEYDLINTLSCEVRQDAGETRALSRGGVDEMTRIQSFGASRSGEFSTGAGRRSRRRGNRSSAGATAQASAGRKRWPIAIFFFVAVTAGAAAYWFQQNPDNPLKQMLAKQMPEKRELATGISEKTRELNEQAAEALESGRWYEPEDDNAQHYYTTLLALYPDDEQALGGVTRLYRSYLDETSAAITSSDFDKAEVLLNQASQIAYYITNDDYVEQQAKLRAELILAQQQSIIAKERAVEVDRLLGEADGLMRAEHFTTPPGENAYDKYQQVLSLDPASTAATEGIEAIAGNFLERAEEQSSALEFTLARASMAAAAQIFPRHPRIEAVRDDIERREAEQGSGGGDTGSPMVAQESASTEESASSEESVSNEESASNEEIAGLLAAAEEDIAAYRLTAPKKDNALEKYHRILALDPANEAAIEGLEKVAVRYIHMAQTAIGDGRLEEAERYLDQARQLSPTQPLLQQVQGELISSRELIASESAAADEVAGQVQALWQEVDEDIKAGRLYTPIDNSAILKVRKILELEPDNEAAIEKWNSLMPRIADKAWDDISRGDFEQAELAIDFLAGSELDQPALDELRDALLAAQLESQQSAGVFAGPVQAAPVGQPPSQEVELLSSARTQAAAGAGSGPDGGQGSADLQAAYHLIEQERSSGAPVASIEASMDQLASRYASEIEMSLVAGDLTGARALLDNVSEFGLVGHGLGELAVRLSVLESKQTGDAGVDAIENLY